MKLGHHVFPKSSSNNLRYDPLNGIPTCLRCHFKHHKFQNPELLYKALEKRGFPWFVRLLEKSKESIKPNRKFYEEAIKTLEEYINEHQQPTIGTISSD